MLSAASGSAGLVLPPSLSSASPNGRCNPNISELLPSLHLLQWEAQGSTRPAIISSTTSCVLLSLEAAISSACSHSRAGHPHATLSSSLAKPTGLYIAHRFLGGTLGYQNFEVSEDVLPLSVGSTFPLSLEPCMPRVDAAPGAWM